MNFRSLVKKIIPRSFFGSIEPYGHLLEAVIFNVINGFPLKGIKVIGITGTNGKTTTTFMVFEMLRNAGYKVGLMSTVAYGVGDDIKPQIHHMTTVSPPELMKRVRSMKKQGMEWLVLETTSQALAQHRVWGTPYTIAVMTNLTHEHLDYHKTFERYRDAKRMLFKMTNRNKKGLRVGIVNADDPNAAFFAADIKNPITYGIEAGDVRAQDIELQPDKVAYKTTVDNQTYEITAHIPGNFNVYNSLVAVIVGHVLKLSKKQIEQGIAALAGVEGRMTTIDEGQPFHVIVDFAHTPDSFEKLFKDLRPVIKGKMIVMFGSAGRRDESKRAVQGEIAGKYADEVIVTEEDDRDVDGQKIMEQIAEGAEKAGKHRDKDLFLVHDRSKAIAFAVSRAKSDQDTILLLGKGHEKTIERSNGENPWNEIEEARLALQRIKSK